MGSISQFDLQPIINDFKIDFFIETGTWKGDAVAYALQFPFRKIISVEIIPGIAEEARLRFRGEPRVSILTGHSPEILQKVLPELDGNCLFWLDAHYPGAEAGIAGYDATGNESLRLPLEEELAVIRQCRKKHRDVFIIDDLRVYEDGDFENGPAPADTLPRSGRSPGFFDRYFLNGYHIRRIYRDEGYLLVFPHNKRSWLSRLFG